MATPNPPPSYSPPPHLSPSPPRSRSRSRSRSTARPSRSCIQSLLLVALVASLCARARAHSFLVVPQADYKPFSKPECRVGGPTPREQDNCPGPCIAPSSWQYDAQHGKAVQTVYRRGQRVRIVWTRNNHRGGFVRLSLVPLAERMSHPAHDRGAFHFACFEAGVHACPPRNSFPGTRGRNLCGTDTRGLAQHTYVDIPTYLPNGRYVLGWAWFGGTQLNPRNNVDMSFFGDYWSCADVTIRGGAERTWFRYQPVFIPGMRTKLGRSVGTDSCLASVNRHSTPQCKREPCRNIRARFMVPNGFVRGQTRRPDWKRQGAQPPPPPRKKQPTSNTNNNKKPTPRRDAPNNNNNNNNNRRRRRRGKNAAPRIKALVFVNAKNRRVLQRVNTNNVVRVPFGARPGVLVDVAGPVSRVSCFVNGRRTSSESVRPFSCFGDVASSPRPWPRPPFGRRVTIRVVAFGNRRRTVLKIKVLLKRG